MHGLPSSHCNGTSSPAVRLLCTHLLHFNSASFCQIFIDPHQRCRYSDSPFARKDTFLYCRVQKWVEGGGHRGTVTHKTKLILRKKHVFVIEKYIEDVKQDGKHVPDLLESIMRPTCLAKEELRPNLFKLRQFGPKTPTIKVSPFWTPEI